MTRRVVVTGVGPVSSIGIGKEAFWENARAGRGFFREVDFTGVDLEQYRSRICSPVDGFKLSGFFERPKRLSRSGKATQYSAAGALLALEDAGFRLERRDGKSTEHFTLEGEEPFRCGVILGQAVSNHDVLLPAYRQFLSDRGPKRISPFTLPQSNANVGATTVSEMFRLKGTCLTVATACTSATQAMGISAANIAAGVEDVILTGGAEFALEPYLFSGFDIIQALSRRNDAPLNASRPFDKGRDGFVLGEGAGILVLEELGHALARGARVYGEILGFGSSADAYHVVAPDPEGRAAVHAVRKALSMARVSPGEVEYINAHGTSTLLNDPTESYVIKQVFGDYAYRVPVSSSKSCFGHPLGAAGGLESIVTLLVMEHGVIAPTANLENPDAEYVDPDAPHLDKRCDLDYVPIVPREKTVRLALKQSFGFGGQNAALVFKKWE
jgi:3-oxoacyl-[acyl-carrier-protein] synthase II